MARPEENHANLGMRPPPEARPTTMEAIGDVAGRVAKELGQVVASPVVAAAEAVKATPDVPGMLADKVKANHLNQPSFTGQMAAEGREALKDVNNTLMEVFFGHPTGAHEPGTPLAPTQSMVSQDLGKMPGLDELRAHAAQRAQQAAHRMDGNERGGATM